MSNLEPFPAGTLADYAIRGAITTPRLRPADPGINQEHQATVDGLGSADYEDPHGNV